MSTYYELEQSKYRGQPIEGYHFQYQSQNWYYTSGNDPFMINTFNYEPNFIKRGTINTTEDLDKISLIITMSLDDPVARLFSSWLDGAVTLTIVRTHVGASSHIVYWSGRALSCKIVGNKAELSCESFTTTMKRSGIRRVYNVGCPHMMYSKYNCKLRSEDWEATTVALAIDGVDVTIGQDAGAVNEYFYGGYMKFGSQYRMITKMVPGVEPLTGVATLIGPMVGLEVNDVVMVYPGCDKRYSTCRDVFDNELNYGGFTHIPNMNPFSNALV